MNLLYNLYEEAEACNVIANELEYLIESSHDYYITEAESEGFFAKIIRKIGECIQKLKDFFFGSKMKSNLENGPKKSNAAGKEIESNVKNTHRGIKQIISDAKKAKTQSEIDSCNSRLDKIKTVAIGAGVATGAVVGTTFLSGMIKSLTADAESVEREAKSTKDFIDKATSGSLNKVQLGVWKAKGTLLGKIASKITQFGSFCGSKLASKNKYAAKMHDVTNASRSIYTNKKQANKFSDKKAVDAINKFSGDFGGNAIGGYFPDYVDGMLDKLNISCEELAELARKAMKNVSEYGVNVLNQIKDKNDDTTGDMAKIKKTISDTKSYLSKMSKTSSVKKIFLDSDRINTLYDTMQEKGISTNASSVFSGIYEQIRNCIFSAERTAKQCIDNSVLIKINDLPQLPKKSSGKRVRQPKVPKPVGDTTPKNKKYPDNNKKKKKIFESSNDDYIDLMLDSYLDLD